MYLTSPDEGVHVSFTDISGDSPNVEKLILQTIEHRWELKMTSF